MAALEIVYAVHKFEAENIDEISINIGEQVIVLEKDEGFNDGWWQGRNVRGEIGLFPITYTVKRPPPSAVLENKIETLETAISKMKTEPIQKKSSISSISSKNMQSIMTQSLKDTELNETLVKEWTSEQVAIWLMSVGFDKELADNFKDQEISGDILLELTLDSLKELQVTTFGKRFKIHNAINALRLENKRQKYSKNTNVALPNNIEARVASPFPNLNRSNSNHQALASYYNMNKQAYPDDDMVSDYSTIIRNSQIEPKPSQLISRPSIPLDMELIASSPRLSTLVEQSTSADFLYERQKQQQQQQQQHDVRQQQHQQHQQQHDMRQQQLRQKQQQQQQEQQQRLQYLDQQKQQQQQRPVSHQITPSPITSSTSSEWKRNTMNNMKSSQEIPLQDGNGRISTRYSFIKNSLNTNKLQSVLPNSQMVRRSEDVPNDFTNDLSGMPNMEGWLYKQGDKYKTWNKRWFVLKANNLFYFKSPSAVRMKGIINLKGYRIEVDESIHVGKYCFMAHHPKERTFYFYTDFEKHMKEWLKALMKATIARDYATPVMSSSTIPTVSLEMARKMRPRPPSTIFQQQKPLRSPTPNSHLNQHFSLMSLDQNSQPIIPYHQESRAPSVMSTRPPPSETKRDNASDYSVASHNNNSRLKDSGFNSTHGGHLHTETSSNHSSSGRQSVSIYSMRMPQNDNNTAIFFPDEEDEDLIDPEHMSVIESNRHYREEELAKREPLNTKQQAHVVWINRHIQNKISALSDLYTGEVLLEFLESVSNKEIMKPVVLPTQSENTQRMDRVITAFKFMSLEGVELDGSCTIRDVLNGNENKITYMLDAVEYWVKTTTDQTSSKKMASGGTFGEDDQCHLRELEQQQG